MEATIVRRLTPRCVTVAHAAGHEFDFEAGPSGARLYAARWKNKRLPLDADRCRRIAASVATDALHSVSVP